MSARVALAIIGGGASALAAALAARARGVAATVIAPAGADGCGLAYSTVDPLHRLNVCAARMSIVENEPHDFVAWLQSRDGKVQPQDYYPRAVYGEYLRQHWRTLSNVVAAEALALAAIQNGWRIQTTQGALDATRVILAIGVPPAQPLIPVSDARYRLDGYAPRDAWPRRGLLIGSSLTAVDIALSWCAARADAELTVISRHGLWPLAHNDLPRHGQIALDIRSPRHILRSMRRAIATGVDPCAAVDSLRDATVELWTGFSRADRAQFLRHARSRWDSARHRMAPHVAQALAALQADGRVRLVAGRIRGIAADGDLAVDWQPRGRARIETLRVDEVVQCTGFDGGLTSAGSPLLRSLLDAGLAQADAHRLGLALDRKQRVIGAGGRAHATLFALGALGRGSLWECIAIPEIRSSAAAMVVA